MIKVGDVVGVRVTESYASGVYGRTSAGITFPLDHNMIVPIPAPDPLAGCKEDVIDAAIVLASHGDGAEVNFQYNGETFSHYGFYTNVFKPRVDALIEAQRPRPPSKYAALRKALNSCAWATLGAELAKLEAEERWTI